MIINFAAVLTILVVKKGFIFIINKKILKKVFNICILPLYFYITL